MTFSQNTNTHMLERSVADVVNIEQ